MDILGWEMHAVGQPLRPSRRTLTGPAAGQALVEVAGCGVCHTDLGFLDGRRPTRHGAAAGARARDRGRSSPKAPACARLLGARVVVPAVIPCGNCDAVPARSRRRSAASRSSRATTIHGGFATHVVVPARGLCPVPLEGRAGERSRPAWRSPSCRWWPTRSRRRTQAVRRASLRRGDARDLHGRGRRRRLRRADRGGARRARRRDRRGRGRSSQLAAAHRRRAHARRARAPSQRPCATRCVRIAEGAGPAGSPSGSIFETSGTRAGRKPAFGLLVHGAPGCPWSATRREARERAALEPDGVRRRAEGTWGCPPELYPEVLDLVLSRRGGRRALRRDAARCREINEVFARAARSPLGSGRSVLPVPGGDDHGTLEGPRSRSLMRPARPRPLRGAARARRPGPARRRPPPGVDHARQPGAAQLVHDRDGEGRHPRLPPREQRSRARSPSSSPAPARAPSAPAATPRSTPTTTPAGRASTGSTCACSTTW